MNIRVLTLNIHKGLNAFGRKYVLESLRRAMRELDADILCLQEVVGRNLSESETLQSQYEYLADSIWSHYSYGQNAVLENFQHGNAILTKFPIEMEFHLDLAVRPYERRGLLHVMVDADALPSRLHLLCTHLGLRRSERRMQIRKIVQYLELIPKEDAVILAGDFNDWGTGETHRLLDPALGFQEVHLALRGKYARTFPSILPLLQLDRIYFKNMNVLSAMKRGWGSRYLSDHCIVGAELTLRRTEGESMAS